MRTWCCVVALSVLGGCSGPNDSPPSSPPPPSSGEGGGRAGYQCTVGPRRLLAAADAVAAEGDGAPWFVGGPSGARVYARGADGVLRWSDGRRGTSLPAMIGRDGRGVVTLREGRFGWAGERYLVIAGDHDNGDGLNSLLPDPVWRGPRLFATDEGHGDLRAVRAGLPTQACDVRITETPVGALVTWIRRGPGGCAEGGEGWVQAFDARGEPVGSARALTLAEQSVPLRSLSGRWDFGRAVLSGRGDRIVSWVLDGRGAVLAADDAGDVACPRAGCGRVRVEEETGLGAAEGNETGAAALRLEPLGDEAGGRLRGLRVQLRRATVRGLAVSGDLLLVLHRAQGGGCDLSIVDLEQRAVVSEHHESTQRACDAGDVRALPRGFALAGFLGSSGPFTVTFDCPRPPR